MTNDITYPFIAMHGFIIANKSLSNTEKILYSYFVGLALSGNEIYPSNAYLCSLVNIKERQLREIFEHLEELFLIKRFYKGSRRYVEVLDFNLNVTELRIFGLIEQLRFIQDDEQLVESIIELLDISYDELNIHLDKLRELKLINRTTYPLIKGL